MERIRTQVEECYAEDVEEERVDGNDLEKLGLRGIKLRPYQLSGVNWLIQRYTRSHGCILGDEMGLGKTCQTISFLVYLHSRKEMKKHRAHLILCPLSVINNWKEELHEFAPKLKLLSYIGDKDTREELREKIDEEMQDDSYPFHILLTTYELCLKDSSFLNQIQWHTLVVDEAHRLKNQESLLYQTLKGFSIEHRVLLTGTPIQNNLTELYSLLSFVNPRLFKLRYQDEFLDKYRDVDNSKKDRHDLHQLLQPFILRRVKNEVLKDLPKKTEVVLYHGITALQKKYYRAILTKDLDAFETSNPYGPPKTRLMNILMQLRKCVAHPYLFDGVEPEPFELGEHLVDASGKLILIDQLLTYLKPRGHKVLLFSQMTRMLDILQDYLGYRGYSYERLDGSVRGEERFLAVQNFNKQEDNFIFLLSTKAGGQGLNLVSADTVIFVDSDFNPQNDLQAAARAHRIGQKRAVKVIRLIGRSTVEEIVLRRAEAKLKLTQSVIEGGQFSLGATEGNKEALVADDSLQLQDILKFGVDQLFESDEGTLEDLDFDHILGPTKDGRWLADELDQRAGEMIDEDGSSDNAENLYVFEGKDYSKGSSDEDRKVFDQLLAAEIAKVEENVSSERSLRKKKGPLFAALPDIPQKPRKKLSEEEKAERKRKRAETAARRAQEAEEEEVRRAQERKQKREDKWRANGYISCNIELDSDSEEETEDEEEEEENGGSLQISYVSGDVTHPIHTGNKDAFIVHCVDDSGHWGTGGLFSALSARSQQPETQYELAGNMKDLALGDTHIVPVDDLQSREKGNDMAALIVAHHRDRKNNLSGIKLPALEEGLQRLHKAAKEKKASVHLPRIGYNTPGFNWYGTERLIRKWLAAKSIPTYIYYYPRRRAAKRKHSEEDSEQENKMKPNKAPPAAESPSPTLPTHMHGVNAYFHNIPEDEVKNMKRYLIAYDGDVCRAVDENTTHVLVNTGETDTEIFQSWRQENKDLKIIQVKWLQDCLKKGKKIREESYLNLL